MIQCIVIDGWHKGHLVTLPALVRELRLPRPEVVTVCDCRDEEESWRSAPQIDTYLLAFQSVDGKVALYSVKGDSTSIVGDRTQWFPERGSTWRETPLYVGCHDDRAVFDSSSAA